MRVGYACKNITLGKDGGSRTMTRKRYLDLSYEDAKKRDNKHNHYKFAKFIEDVRVEHKK